MLTVREMVV